MDTNRNWETFGAQDPYFAVLTTPKYRGTLSPEARAEFFKGGQELIDHVLRNIHRHLDPTFAPRSALDFGCGVGRTAIPLARICQTTGVDISSSMLKEAERNADAAGVPLRLCQASSETFDLIHSHIVFQHIPVKQGLAIAEDLLARVNPGGVAVLHFTYRSTRPWPVRALNWLRYRSSLVQFATNLLRDRPLREPAIQMNTYPLEALLALFVGKRMYLEHTNHGGYLGIVAYLKPPISP